MSLTFGLGGESDLIGALSVLRSSMPKNDGGGAAAFFARPSLIDFLERAAPWPRNRFPRGTMSSQEKEFAMHSGALLTSSGWPTMNGWQCSA